MPVGTRSKIRELIRGEELINKLQDSVLGDNPVALGQNEVNVCKILLAKWLPDLKAVEHTGDVEHDIKISWMK